MEKRLITKRQEEALRLCHHDFEGWTQEEAAKIMGISQPALHYLLSRVEKVLPQYFPIMTKQEAKIYHYYMVDDWSVKEIAEHMNLSKETTYKALQRVKRKGFPFTPAKGRLLHPDSDKDEDGRDMDWNSIDEDIKYKF